jgi:DNA replication protein DnaC
VVDYPTETTEAFCDGHVRFYTAAALVHELLEARDEKRLLRLQRRLAGYKLLIIDELGYVPLSQTGAELLFEMSASAMSAGQPSSLRTCRSTNGRPCSGPSV